MEVSAPATKGQRRDAYKKKIKEGSEARDLSPGIHPPAAFTAYFISICFVIIQNHVPDIHMRMTVFNIKDQAMTQRHFTEDLRQETPITI